MYKTFKINSLANNHVNEYLNSDGDHLSDLVSYTTRVASYNHKTNEMQVFGWYSMTTAKHINSFLNFYGFDPCTKKELMNYNKSVIKC
jgi:hypothetical protein